jgi:HK97 family phage major capsid protein
MTDVTEVKTLIEQQGKAFEAFKSANDQMQAEIKKLGAADAVTAEKVAKLDEALTKLSEAKDAIEAKATDLEKKFNRPGIGHNGGPSLEESELKSFNLALKSHSALFSRAAPADVTADGLGDYRKGFNTFLRKGKEMLEDAERKGMLVGSDPDGGYMVTPDVSGRIIKRVFETSPMRQIASVQTIGTNELEGIIDNDEADDGGWVGEQTTRTETGTPQVGKWKIPVHEVYAQPKATQQLLDDANVDIEAWLAAKVADKLTRKENAAFMTGDGSNKPKGLFAYSSAATADSSRAWGVFEHIVTGANGGFAASNPADVLFSLIGAFKDAYLTNARFLTRREVITLIRKFKDGNSQYLWQPGLQQGQPQSILGFPVSIAADTPAIATASLSLAFGDFKEAYQIVDRQGFRTLRDNLTSKPFVKFYTTRRVGGGAVQFEAVKFLKFST